MSITKTLQKALVLPIALFVFLAGALFVSIAINTNAQSISLEPVSIDRSNPDERGWFIYNVKPGETIEDTLVVRNTTSFPTNVQLNANDATVTADGTFSLSPNDVQNTQLGSWISLSKKELPVGAKENLAIPFTIKVPSDAKSGEYAGGLSAIIITDADKDTGIGAKLRIGVRMYLTVSGNLELNPSISKIEIANPKSADLEAKLRSRGSTSPDSMGFYLIAEEKGNIYSKNYNKATFTTPDGATKTKSFTRNLIPGQPETEFYLETGIPYQVGETKVKLDYEVVPFIDNKPDLKSQNTTGSIEYTMNLTQAEYDEFAALYDQLKNEKDENRPDPVVQQGNSANTSFTVGEDNTVEVIREVDNTNQYLTYGLIGVISVLIIALILIVLRSKKTKDEPKIESTVNSNPSDTTKPKK